MVLISLKKIILTIGTIATGILPAIVNAACTGADPSGCFPMPSFSDFVAASGGWITGPLLLLFGWMWPFLLFLVIIIVIVLFRKSYVRRLRDWMGWELFEMLIRLFLLYLMILFLLCIFDKENFWKWSLNGLLFLVIISFIVSIIHKFKNNRWQKIMREIVSFAKQNKLDDTIGKFIDDFRRSGKGLKSSWNYRGYSFDYYRLRDLQSILRDKGLELSMSKLLDLIVYYIDIRERLITLHGSN
jgi:membrane protein implicated in regulation of membrane protease activity